jgi:hypothetical protein
MKGSSAQAWLVEQVELALGPRPFERRLVFGCPTFFARGHVFAVIWDGPGLVLKFTGSREAREARALPGAADWFPRRRGPAAVNAVLLPEALHEAEEALSLWLGRAHAQACAAPPRQRERRARPPAATRSSRLGSGASGAAGGAGGSKPAPGRPPQSPPSAPPARRRAPRPSSRR